MEKKVYLRIGTPRSLKDPVAGRLALTMAMCVVGLVAVTVMNFVMEMETAKMFAIFVGIWLIAGAVPMGLMFFNSYAYVSDRELVCNLLGFFEKRYACGSLERVEVVKGRIAVYAGGKVIVSMPNNEAARELVRELHVPCEL